MISKRDPNMFIAITAHLNLPVAHELQHHHITSKWIRYVCMTAIVHRCLYELKQCTWIAAFNHLTLISFVFFLLFCSFYLFFAVVFLFYSIFLLFFSSILKFSLIENNNYAHKFAGNERSDIRCAPVWHSTNSSTDWNTSHWLSSAQFSSPIRRVRPYIRIRAIYSHCIVFIWSTVLYIDCLGTVWNWPRSFVYSQCQYQNRLYIDQSNKQINELKKKKTQNEK